MYYILQSDPVESRGYSRHYSYLKEKTIPLPPLEIQEQIVAEIEEQEEKIEEYRNNIKDCEQKINAKINEVWGSEIK